MKVFKAPKLVRMQHCDTGGIVFTPQYFNLFTEVLEDWFARELDYSFNHMLATEQSGTPAMRITARFAKPSRLGDKLDFSLSVKQLRSKYVIVNIQAHSGKEFRCESDFQLGFVTRKSFRLERWPDELAAKMRLFQ